MEEKTIAKLEVIASMSSDAATKQLCDVMIDYITKQHKTQLGFSTDSALPTPRATRKVKGA